MFIQNESAIKTWAKLKSVLLEEFSEKISTAELHKQLVHRRIKKDESVQEYYLVMKELAARGNIEQNALFDYMIDGLRDDPNNNPNNF